MQTFARLLARRGLAREEAVTRLLDPVLTRACARFLLAEASRRRARIFQLASTAR